MYGASSPPDMLLTTPLYDYRNAFAQQMYNFFDPRVNTYSQPSSSLYIGAPTTQTGKKFPNHS